MGLNAWPCRRTKEAQQYAFMSTDPETFTFDTFHLCPSLFTGKMTLNTPTLSGRRYLPADASWQKTFLRHFANGTFGYSASPDLPSLASWMHAADWCPRMLFYLQE